MADFLPGRLPGGAEPGAPLLELEIGPVAHGGACVARTDGRVVFVRHALPGERVLALVTDRAHDRYWRADAVEILEASPDRVTPPCPHAGPGRCGGCDWQHATLAAQRRLKAQVVVQALRRQGGLAARAAGEPPEAEPLGKADGASDELAVAVEPLAGPGGDDGLGWRTRMRFAAADDGTLGLRAHRSHRVVATPECRIAHPLVADAVAGRGFPGADAVEVAASVTTGQVSVRPSAGRTAGTCAGEDGSELVERVRGRAFRIDAASFWQVHPAAASTLVDAVLAALEPRPGERALDLYAGAGLFAAFLAEAVGPGGQVVAMESDAAAVTSAGRSLADLPWVSVRPVRVTAATVRGAMGSRTAGSAVDVAVLDPPRTGAGADVLTALLGLGPRAVAYVACDPVALGRDLAVAAAAGYRVSDVRGFDLFPMTAHVECVARLVPVT
jgi:tRNA/tmRNA/rRNA uracil-C5-methylase (TrmA/RlmC/RlmD family)